ncbi:MAG: ABC transporter ATP-binding protein [Clostridium celatum]|uniref:ABC transporter ATP-binding protein n=1 Tax=Clostridium sp. TaxID=1506 RepID=UPI0025C04D83|nr:ABC transporter ATP-binding protein [Clostridium sp.]MBS4956269.1 ABC transporter ATP-binding protein [Clostridium sp.]MBS6184262.1 ABC transporter ATP-binding protein [Clostridium celatum]MDU2122239.1 ABC transporter ATP-binding protein [Clostridium celatum]MDU4978180.1 ABC transporter ATP-binding protein [Clostridium celatum]
MIKAKDLYFSYDKDKSFITKLNVEIEKGKITAILGPNGSGKSTLLSIFAGLNKPTSGEVIINGKSIRSLKQKELAREIATVHQQNTVPSDITVKELVAYGRIPHKKYFQGNTESDDKIIEWAIKRTGLEKLKDKAVMGMSGGERQRAFIAMALAQKSEILFLDEPTTYLDIYHQVEILELVKELNKESKLTVVMVLHDINQAIKYSDNVIVMKSGEVVSSGIANEVINMDLLNSVYKIGGFINEVEKEIVFVPLKLKNKI